MIASLADAPKGHRFPAVEFELSPEWVQGYTDAVEDAAIGAYEGIVPPMAVAALSIRALLENASLPPGAVHLGQEIAFLRKVRVGEPLRAEAEVASRGERQGWVLMTVGVTVSGGDGEEVMSGRATVTFPLAESGAVAQEEGVRGTGRASRPAGEPLPEVVRPLTQETIRRYAAASGDHNPLHVDPAFAAGTRFGGTIAHGMLLLAYVSEMLTAGCGEAWLSGGRLKARFRAPARPGDTVIAKGARVQSSGGRAVYDVECRNQAGELLVTGEAEVPN